MVAAAPGFVEFEVNHDGVRVAVDDGGVGVEAVGGAEVVLDGAFRVRDELAVTGRGVVVGAGAGNM